MVRSPFAGTVPRAAAREPIRAGASAARRACVAHAGSRVTIRRVTWGHARVADGGAGMGYRAFREIGFAPWSRGERRWPRAPHLLLGRLLGSLALRDRKRGLGAGMSRRSGRLSSALAGGARVGASTPVSRRARAGNLRGDRTQSRYATGRPRVRTSARTRKATRPLEEDFAENLLLVMGARKRVGGVRGAPEGGVSGSAIAPRKTYRLERLRYRGADVIARKTTRPTQSTVAHLETAARAASWGAAATKAAIAAVVTFTTSVCTGCWYAAGVGCELALVPLPPPTSAQSSADCSHGGL